MRTCLKHPAISLIKYAVQLAILACLTPIPLIAQERLPQDSWETVTIDTIEIGYGLQIDDVNGDGKLSKEEIKNGYAEFFGKSLTDE